MRFCHQTWIDLEYIMFNVSYRKTDVHDLALLQRQNEAVVTRVS